MISPDLIKPVPKVILAKIRRQGLKDCPAQQGACRFYSYLTKIKGELVKITVAVKNHYNKWHYKQVAAHGAQSELAWVRDMEYIYFGYGFRVGWYADGLQKRQKWYEDGKWYDAKCKYYNPWSVTVNPEFVDKFPEYRYSAYRLYEGNCIVTYLRLYEQYPQTEYLLKAGLFKLHNSVTVLKRVAKDRMFCKWLITHKDEITAEHCYIGSVMRAYKTGKSLKQVQLLAHYKKRLQHDTNYEPIRELFGNELERFFSYLDAQGTDMSSYRDYLNACNYLSLDMTLPKNQLPHDFKHWHDTRIDMYHTAKAETDAQARAELYAQFAAVAGKYTALGHRKTGVYAVTIAASPAELIREGDLLKHCVGRMNYEKKMAREETLIFFVRDIAAPDVPFVTVEYSPSRKQVLQCYGYDSKKPDDSVVTFVNKVWLPYANRTVKKITAAA